MPKYVFRSGDGSGSGSGDGYGYGDGYGDGLSIHPPCQRGANNQPRDRRLRFSTKERQHESKHPHPRAPCWRNDGPVP